MRRSDLDAIFPVIEDFAKAHNGKVLRGEDDINVRLLGVSERLHIQVLLTESPGPISKRTIEMVLVGSSRASRTAYVGMPANPYLLDFSSVRAGLEKLIEDKI